jgi:hypothetical protein
VRVTLATAPAKKRRRRVRNTNMRRDVSYVSGTVDVAASLLRSSSSVPCCGIVRDVSRDRRRETTESKMWSLIRRCVFVIVSVGVVLASAFLTTWAASVYRSWP